MRALDYFDLVRLFGGYPLITESTGSLNDLYVERNDPEQVYDQVINDLQDAETVLPLSYTGSDVCRATKGAAKALLARVLLYKGDYAGSAQKAKEVMDLGVYDLFDSVDDLWKVANENGIEHIFSVQYLAGVQGSGYSSSFATFHGNLLNQKDHRAPRSMTSLAF